MQVPFCIRKQPDDVNNIASLLFTSLFLPGHLDGKMSSQPHRPGGGIGVNPLLVAATTNSPSGRPKSPRRPDPILMNDFDAQSIGSQDRNTSDSSDTQVHGLSRLSAPIPRDLGSPAPWAADEGGLNEPSPVHQREASPPFDETSQSTSQSTPHDPRLQRVFSQFSTTAQGPSSWALPGGAEPIVEETSPTSNNEPSSTSPQGDSYSSMQTSQPTPVPVIGLPQVRKGLHMSFKHCQKA